jgi:hypothetical protein
MFHGLGRQLRSERLEFQSLAEIIRCQSAAFNDALQGADRDRFAPVPSHDDLTRIFMPPLLVTPALSNSGRVEALPGRSLWVF